MEPITILVVMGSVNLLLSLSHYTSSWWERRQQRQRQIAQAAAQAAEEQVRSQRYLREITKVETPSLFCQLTRKIASECKEGVGDKQLHPVELKYTWNGAAQQPTVQIFYLPLPGQRLCLDPDRLWVTISPFNRFEISAFLFEAVSAEMLQNYLNVNK